MVKLTEAEKRGRGSDGNDHRMSSILMPLPKISHGTWEALKAHILRERRRKKEELEADAEEKRMRKERENRKKQHAMTLEETREQITNTEQKLVELRAKKEELVQQYKKCCQVSENEKQQQQQEQQQAQQQQQQQLHQQQQQQQQNFLKESAWTKCLIQTKSPRNEIVPVHPYHASLPPHMMFPSTMVSGRSAAVGNIPTIYKVTVATTQPIQNILTTSSVKRSRSPSPPPPPHSNYQPLPFMMKNMSGSQTSILPVTHAPSKSGSGTSVYLSSQLGPYYHSTSAAAGAQYSTQPTAVVAPSFLAAAAGPPPGSAPSNQREDKHMQPIYLPAGRVSSSHVSGIHAFESKPKGGASGPPEKFYLPAGRTPLMIRADMLPVQPPAARAKGGISTGFPVRGPPPTSQGQGGSAPHAYSSHPSHNYY